jgi:hypothetical protein
VLNTIRRALRLHVHDWEEIAGEKFESRGGRAVPGNRYSPRPLDSVQAGWRPWDVAPAPAVVELRTFRCRTCQRTRTSRVRVG